MGQQQPLEWWSQVLTSPYGGEHTGVKVYDLNNDGFPDILYSAGRHGIDQSYIRMNLGFDEEGYHQFSDALPIGDPGGFYQVDVAPLSSLEAGHVGVLLAGGTCGEADQCQLGLEQPAILLDVSVTGCSVFQYWLPCDVTYSTIWEDTNPGGDRNGALEMSLGDGVDPAMVIVGKEGIKVYEPSNGSYASKPTFLLTQAEKQAGTNAFIRRASSLACGYIGDKPGCVVGVRTYTPPNPLIAVYKDEDGNYDWFGFAGENDAYGSARGFTEGTGVALGDLDGDGAFDVVEASFLNPAFIETNANISQNFYLMKHGSLGETEIPRNVLLESDIPGYSVDVMNIYPDSDLPDIVHGMLDGSVRIYANLGKEDGVFAGFRVATILNVPAQCQIRDLKIASLAPCTVSVITALLCLTDTENDGNYIFTAATGCAPTVSPGPSYWTTSSPAPSITAQPTWRPTTSWWPTSTPWPTITAWPTATRWPTSSPVVQEVGFVRPPGSPAPTENPTTSISPSLAPIMGPTMKPSESRSPSGAPTEVPTPSPASSPTSHPTTSMSPSKSPTAYPTRAFSNEPSDHPTTSRPSEIPTTSPTMRPTKISTEPPTSSPSSLPSDYPSLVPSSNPTNRPSQIPTISHSGSPSTSPTLHPTRFPSIHPSADPTEEPSTATPTVKPIPMSLLPPPSPTSSPSRQALANAESPETPTVSPDHFVEAVDETGVDRSGLDFAEDDSKTESILWPLMALGLSVAMIVVGCVGIWKVLSISRRKNKSPPEGSVISLYLEDDEIEALEEKQRQR
eukprot:scaffold4793_cov175-Amphora_coffeaeformis.AAC.6